MASEQGNIAEATKKLENLANRAGEMERRVEQLQGIVESKAGRSGGGTDPASIAADIKDLEKRVNDLEKTPWATDREGTRGQRQNVVEALEQENKRLEGEIFNTKDLLEKGENKQKEIYREVETLKSSLQLTGATTGTATALLGGSMSPPRAIQGGATITRSFESPADMEQAIADLQTKADNVATKATELGDKMTRLEQVGPAVAQDPGTGGGGLDGRASMLEGKATALDTRLAALEKALQSKGMNSVPTDSSQAESAGNGAGSQDITQLMQMADKLDKKAEELETRLKAVPVESVGNGAGSQDITHLTQMADKLDKKAEELERRLKAVPAGGATIRSAQSVSQASSLDQEVPVVDFNLDFGGKLSVEQECQSLQARLDTLKLQPNQSISYPMPTSLAMPDPVQAQELLTLKVQLGEESSKNQLLMMQLQQLEAELQQRKTQETGPAQELLTLRSQLGEETSKNSMLVMQLSQKEAEMQQKGQEHLSVVGQKEQHIKQKEEDIRNLNIRLEQLSAPRGPDPEQMQLLQQRDQQIQTLNFELSSLSKSLQEKNAECQELSMKLLAVPQPASPQPDQGLILQEKEQQIQQLGLQLRQVESQCQQKELQCKELLGQLAALQSDRSQAEMKDGAVQQEIQALRQGIEVARGEVQQHQQEESRLRQESAQLKVQHEQKHMAMLQVEEQLQRATTTIRELSIESQTLKAENTGLRDKYVEMQAATQGDRESNEQRVAMETNKVLELQQRMEEFQKALDEEAQLKANQESFNAALSQRVQEVYQICASSLYRVDNTKLDAKTHGMNFRLSKSDDNKSNIIVPWGCVVSGSDMGDGWLSVGKFYLPFFVNGVQVLSSGVPFGLQAADVSHNLEELQAFFTDPRSQELDALLRIARSEVQQQPASPAKLDSPLRIVEVAAKLDSPLRTAEVLAVPATQIPTTMGGSGTLPPAAPSIVSPATMLPASRAASLTMAQRQVVHQPHQATAVEYVLETSPPSYPISFAGGAPTTVRPLAAASTSTSHAPVMAVTAPASSAHQLAGGVSAATATPLQGSVTALPHQRTVATTPARARFGGVIAGSSSVLGAVPGSAVTSGSPAPVSHISAVPQIRTVPGGSGTTATAFSSTGVPGFPARPTPIFR